MEKFLHINSILKRINCTILIIALVLVLVPNLGEAKRVEAAGTAIDIVQIANGEVGYEAGANKNNKYGAYFGHNNVDWCGYFVSWCARQAGIPENVIKTNSWGDHDRGNFGCQFYSRGQITPQPGDIVYYDFNGVNGSEHVEIVTEVSNGTLVSVGGNTGTSSGYPNGKVGARRVSLSYSAIYGYERPNYTQIPSDKTPYGYLDSVESAGPGAIKVKGWAYDPDSPNSSIDVHIYIGGEAGTGESHRVVANRESPDVKNIIGVSGNHRFEDIIYTTKTGAQNIYAYGIDVTQRGNNKRLFSDGKMVVIQSDTTKPILSDVQIRNINADGYDIQCKVSDNGYIDRVEFPTWTQNGGQDDIIWGKGIINNGIATYHVNRFDHNNEFGNYITHIYVYDKMGNLTTDSNDGTTTGIVTLKELNSDNNNQSSEYGGLVDTPEKTDSSIDGKSQSVDSNIIKTNNELDVKGTSKAVVTINTSSVNTSNKSTSTNTTLPKYSCEWIDGKWYDASGKNTYAGNLGWKKNNNGWWIEDSTGWYPIDKWQKIDSKWYYFKPSGYMASNEWCNGYWLNSDGSWTYSGKGKWQFDGMGWWFGDANGWYATNCWQKIDDNWYYFNGNGYMVTNQYVGSWWLGSDGVCR